MVQQHTLNNGLRIIMVPVQTFQSVSVGIMVKIGSRYESATEAGMCHFIEHMLFKGTRQRPTPRLIAEAIEGIGGVSNAYTSQENTVYYAKVAATQLDIAIDFLADMVRHPLLRESDIDKERLVIGEEINMVYDMPDTWVSIVADDLLWPQHPLGQNIAGTHESLAGISRETLLPFFERSYHPQNMLVAVGGAFEPDAVVAQIDALLGDWPAAEPPAFAAAPPPPTAPRCRIEPRPIEQGHLCLTMPALSRTDPNRYALSVLNTILGDGMSSRLFQNIREELGLTYAIDSGLNLLQDTGALTVYAGVDPDRATEALQAVLAELDSLRQTPVPADELGRAKEYLKGRMVLGLEDSYSRAAWVAYQALFLDEIKTPEEVLAAYSAITAEDVLAVAQQVLNPQRYTLAAIGPFEPDNHLAALIC
ncbi:MAG: pitrilysin family protein [Anaerolineae bacterium]